MSSLLSLPDDVLENVLSYITYDEVSRCRLVCRRFNYISQRVLNHGFLKVKKYHAECLQKVKVQLPRRESERREHPLASHCHMLKTVETRLSLLETSFMKFIDLNFCCFIPGKVLDEIYKVLRYVTTESNPVHANEVLHELRDLSSMAMEYFDEKIVPSLLNKDSGPRIFTGFNMLSSFLCYHSESGSSHNPASEHKLNKLYHFTKKLADKQNSSIKLLKILNQKVMDLNKQTIEQQNMISSQAEKIKEQDRKIDAMKEILMGKYYIFPSSSEFLDRLAVAYDSKRIKNNSLEICELNSCESPQKRKLRPRPCTPSNRSENFKKLKK